MPNQPKGMPELRQSIAHCFFLRFCRAQGQQSQDRWYSLQQRSRWSPSAASGVRCTLNAVVAQTYLCKANNTTNNQQGSVGIRDDWVHHVKLTWRDFFNVLQSANHFLKCRSRNRCLKPHYYNIWSVTIMYFSGTLQARPAAH